MLVGAWDRCLALSKNFRTHNHLDQAARDDCEDHHLEIEAMVLEHGFTMGLSEFNMDVKLRGVPFALWVQMRRTAKNRREIDAAIAAVYRRVTKFDARSDRTGRTVAHGAMSNPAAFKMLAKQPNFRDLILARDKKGRMAIAEYRLRGSPSYAAFQAVARAGVDIFCMSTVGRNTVLDKFPVYWTPEIEEEDGDITFNEVRDRCKLFSFALWKPLRIKDGNNAILHRVGEFLFQTNP